VQYVVTMVILKFFVMFLVALSSAAQETPFAFGNGTMDIFTLPNDDLSSIRIALPKRMKYLGDFVTTVFQNTNGDITFDAAYFEYTPEIIPSSSVPALVAIFWTDIDTRNGGSNQNQLWIRAGTNATDLNLAKDIIAGTGNSFSPQAVVVATWYKVEEYPQIAGPQNTFQLVMAYDEAGITWAIFAYIQIQFTRRAVIGFNDARGLIGELIAGPVDQEIGNRLLNGTNCNRKGIYAYQVNEGIELSGCGILAEQADIDPFQCPVEGGTVVLIRNLPECLSNATVQVFCRFQSDESRLVVSDGYRLVLAGARVSQEAIECVTPFAGVPTTVTVSFAVVGTGIVFDPVVANWTSIKRRYQYLGHHLGLNLPDSAPSTVIQADAPVGITIKWNATTFRQEAFQTFTRIVSDDNITVGGISYKIDVLAYDSSRSTFKLVNSVPVTAAQEALDLKVTNSSLAGYYRTENLGSVAVVIVRLVAFFGRRVGATRSSDLIGVIPPGIGLQCDRFLTPKERCPGVDILPPCPPTQSQIPGTGFFGDDSCPFPEGTRDCTLLSGRAPCFCNYFHDGAAGCYRVRGSNDTGQQCCYAQGGGLIRDPSQGAGTADCIAGDRALSNTIGHFLKDVLPYIVCCKLSNSCANYYRERPSDDGSRFVPPRPPARTFGDPHLRTVDGLEYDFNGSGEFVAVCALPVGNLIAKCNPLQPRLVIGRGTFSLHLRFVPVPVGLGTVTVAAAIEDPLHRGGLAAIAMVPHPTRRLDIFDGETLVDFSAVVAGESTQTVLFPSGLTITRTADLNATTFTIVVSTPSGFVLEIVETAGVMLPSIILPKTVTDGRSVGLFGLVDGDPSNDLTNSTGNVVRIRTNQSQASQTEQIFNQFGVNWMIRDNSASLFQALASSDQSFRTFFDPFYRPVFVAPTIVDPSLRAAADAACAGIQNDAIRNGCYFDIAVTQDAATFGAAARAAVTQQSVIDAVLNSPPEFNRTSDTAELGIGVVRSFPFSATDANGDSIVFSLERNDNSSFVLGSSSTAGQGVLRFLGRTVPGRYIGWIGASDGVAQSLYIVTVDVALTQMITSISEFTLVDSTSDASIGVLGSIVNYTSIKSCTVNLNINAAFAVDSVRSVRVTFDMPSRSSCEDDPPFSVFGDVNGNYGNVGIPLGRRVVTATPYYQPSCQGNAGKSLNQTFMVVGCKTTLVLHNASSDFSRTVVVDLSVLQNVRCKAKLEATAVCGFNIGSARLQFRNAATNILVADRNVSSAPYFLATNNGKNTFSRLGATGILRSGRYFFQMLIDGIAHPRISFTIAGNCI
jgi:AMOP domain/Nidogen-like